MFNQIMRDYSKIMELTLLREGLATVLHYFINEPNSVSSAEEILYRINLMRSLLNAETLEDALAVIDDPRTTFTSSAELTSQLNWMAEMTGGNTLVNAFLLANMHLDLLIRGLEKCRPSSKTPEPTKESEVANEVKDIGTVDLELLGEIRDGTLCRYKGKTYLAKEINMMYLVLDESDPKETLDGLTLRAPESASSILDRIIEKLEKLEKSKTDSDTMSGSLG